MKIIKVKEGVSKIEGDWRNLFEVLDYVKYRPVLFLGDKKITTLWHFIGGYQFSFSLNKIKEKSFPDFAWFSTWIKGRIKTEYGLAAGWKHHLLSTYDNDEELAFNKFFQHLEEFKNSSPKAEIQEIKESQKIKNLGAGTYWKSVYRKTVKIIVFTLPPSKCSWCLYIDKRDNLLAETFADSKKELIRGLKEVFNLNNKWEKLGGDKNNIFIRKILKKPFK